MDKKLIKIFDKII